MKNKIDIAFLKPKIIDQILGQEHLIGKNGIIRKMIEKSQLYSSIFFGPPGIGKSLLAKVICLQLKIKYAIFNPTIHKKNELEKILQESLKNKNEKFVIIIDEIHRLNRDKQDILLSYLEENQVIVLGTTTENPFFVINPAIRSRCQLFELKQITNEQIQKYLLKICKKSNIKISEKILKHISSNSNGDIRSSLNLLNIICNLYENEINDSELLKIIPTTKIVGSSYGNEFYNLQSAFHKSLRGSDIDASIYYLARLIKIGDINSITRRLIAMAYEDIGLANPSLISRVILATNSAERLGFPEAKNILSAITIELCLSPKSNSAHLAINEAIKDVENGLGNYEIPNHLKDSHYLSASKLGIYGYKYPHDYENNWVEQNYLPKKMENKIYYIHGNNEIEIKMNNILKNRKNKAKQK